VKRTIWILGTLAALAVAGVAGYQAGRRGAAPVAVFAAAARAETDPVIYYRDPDGRSFYASAPKKTEDGRDYLPVRASEERTADQLAAPGNATGADRRVVYYRNPMGLADTSPVPKKDSMGMDYIPVYADEIGDGSSIKIAPGKLQRTGVRSEPAVKRILTVPIRAAGTVQLDERRLAVVSLRFEGWVDKVDDVTTGTLVHKGQPLMRVYGSALSAAAAEYAATRESKATSNPSYVPGARQRLQNLGVPDDIIKEMERSGVVPLTVTWTAPRDGIVLERNVVDGQRVMPGDVLFRLADMSTVWVLADIAERDLPHVAAGQTATVRPRGYPQESFTGEVAAIYPQINRETRTARLRIELKNRDGMLRPDMYADAEIATGTDTPVLAVPDNAVIDSGTRQLVLVQKGDGKFEPRPVKLGRRGNGLVEIREGLAENEPVVVSANFLIDAESNLNAALAGLAQGDRAP